MKATHALMIALACAAAACTLFRPATAAPSPTPQSPPPTAATQPATEEHTGWWDKASVFFNYHAIIDNLGTAVAYLAAAWASFTLLQLALVAIPYTARRLFPKLPVLPSASKRFGLLWESALLRSRRALGLNGQEWIRIQLSFAVLLAINTLLGIIPLVLYTAKASSAVSGFLVTTLAALPQNSHLAYAAMVSAIVHCTADVLVNLKHVQMAADGVSLVFTDRKLPDLDGPPSTAGSDVRMQALYAGASLVVKGVADPFATGLHRLFAIAILSHWCHKLTRGLLGRRMSTKSEQSDKLEEVLADVRRHMSLPDAGTDTRTHDAIKNTKAPTKAHAKLEKRHSYLQHLKSGKDGRYKQRAVKEAEAQFDKAESTLAMRIVEACLGGRHPSTMLFCGDNERAEETMEYLNSNFRWLACERAPLPGDFHSAGMETTWVVMCLVSVLLTVLILLFPFLASFNGFMFGIARYTRYAICHQPLPAGGLGSEHADAEWAGVGVFCGSTGLVNWLLVEVWTSLGPVGIMLFVADVLIVYKFYYLGKYGRGEVSMTRLMVFVAYGSCAYDILAVTVGILSGGNILNLFAAWGDAGFAGMMALFGERAEGAALYFCFYILLRVCVLVPLVKLVRPALRASDLLCLPCSLVGLSCAVIACPLASCAAIVFPSYFWGGRHMWGRIWGGVNVAVDATTGYALYCLLWLLSVPPIIVYACCVKLPWVALCGIFVPTDKGILDEMAFKLYCMWQTAVWRLRRWAGTKAAREAKPCIPVEGGDSHEHGVGHFEAHEFFGVAANLVYFPAVIYSAVAPGVTGAGCAFQLQMAAVICFMLRCQQAEGCPSLGAWTVCSVRCRVSAGLLRLLVTAAMLVHKGLTPLQCLPLLVAAVLYMAAVLKVVGPALRSLKQLPYRAAAKWARTLGRPDGTQVVPDLATSRQCFVFASMRPLYSWLAARSSACGRAVRSTTEDGGACLDALGQELRHIGCRAALADMTNSPQRTGLRCEIELA